MKKLLVFIFLLIFTCNAYADINTELKNIPQPKPEQDAIFLYLNDSIFMESKDTKISTTEQAVTLFNKSGREQFSDKKVSIDKNLSELKLIKAGTFLKTGGFEPLEPKGINEVTPPNLVSASIYGKFTSYVYSFPMSEQGNTLYSNYSIKSTIPEKYLSGIYRVKGSTAVNKAIFTLSIPKEETLKYKSTFKVEETKKDDRKIYTIKTSYTDKIKPEVNMPSMEKIADYFIYSTAGNWESALKTFKDNIRAASLPDDDSIPKKAAELTKNLKTDREKVLAIARFLNRNISNISLPFGTGDFKINNAGKVLKNGYGDVKDKTALFIALLKACNIESEPALVRAEFNDIVEEVPTIRQFSVLFACIKLDDGSWGAIDVTSDLAKTGFLNVYKGSKMLLVGDKCEIIDLKPYENIANDTYGSITGVLDKNGTLNADIKVSGSGIYDTYLRTMLLPLRTERLSMFYDRLGESFYAGTKVKKFSNSSPDNYSEDMNISITSESSEFAIKQGDFFLLNITPPPLSFVGIPYDTSAATREYPYVLGSPKKLKYTFEVTIPKGYEPIYLPQENIFKEGNFLLSVTCKYDLKQNKILFSREMLTQDQSIPPESYPLLKKAVDTVSSPSSKLILLRKVK